MPFYQIDQTAKEGEDPIAPRVIEADNPASALRHAAQTTFKISKPLNQSDLVALLTSGTKVEKAGAEPTSAAAGDTQGG